MVVTRFYEMTPEVNPAREFLEIAADFSNPLEIVREAISNSFDAKAKSISFNFGVKTVHGKKKLKIVIQDDGTGMDYDGLKSFFDLGNSLRRETKIEDTKLIGEKGHGTKIYFNSDQVIVTTGMGGKKFIAKMDYPRGQLLDEIVPKVSIEESEDKFNGTQIEIIGYNEDERSVFTHAILKDYIYWFTKFGSFEQELFGGSIYSDFKIHLKGIDRVGEPEVLDFGHKFPEESLSLDKLLDEYLEDAPNFFVKKLRFVGRLRKKPDISYEALFVIEGDKAKRSVNPMIKKRRGGGSPEGAYRVQERYGIWLTKDFIPIQRKNDWIGSKGSEYIKFHAFFNCQELKLTANRGSVDNTTADILDEIRSTILDIYNNIMESEDWVNLEYLEQESQTYQTKKKEDKDLEKRLKLISQAKQALYKDIWLREPRQEHGVFSIYHTIDLLEPTLFPFEIVDYDTHAGIDVIARNKNSGVELNREYLRFVEFKHILKENFNHSFGRLYGIVCWKLSLKHDEVVTDSFGAKRKLRCIPRTDEGTYTRYYLEDDQDPHRIEVIVLEEYLQQRLGIIFQRIKR